MRSRELAVFLQDGLVADFRLRELARSKHLVGQSKSCIGNKSFWAGGKLHSQIRSIVHKDHAKLQF